MNNPSKSFEHWITEQRELGLVDIKLAVTGGKDVSVFAVKEELMKSEALLRAGMGESLPVATQFLPADVLSAIDDIKVDQ